MTDVKKAIKHRAKNYMDRRTHEEQAPLTPEEAKRELGWNLIPANHRLDRNQQD